MSDIRLILVVEDDPNDQLLIEQAFRKAGVTSPIQIVSSVAEGISYLKGNGDFGNREKYPYPSIIMTDLKMGSLSGFELLKFLNDHASFAVIPTIVFSSSTDPDDVKQAYLLGATSYHTKPNNFNGLVSELGLLNAYWSSVLVPKIESSGSLAETSSKGKLSEMTRKPGEEDKPRS